MTPPTRSAMFFATLEAIDDFETQLRTLRAVRGMATAREQGRLRGCQLKLTTTQQHERHRLHGTGTYTVGGLAEFFSVSRLTVYRSLRRITSDLKQA